MKDEHFGLFKDSLNSIYSTREIDFFWKELQRYNLTSQHERLSHIIERLIKNEPIQYITGQSYFYDREFSVNTDTLIPRPETEELVDLIIKDHKEISERRLEILDIGTGSGCIPIILASHLKHAVLTALDVSQEAIKVAGRNAERYNLNIKFLIEDIRAYEAPGLYDVIVSNPPYIPQTEKSLMHKNVLDHEPGLALFVSDEDPLVFYRSIADFAWIRLKNNGYLYFECNEYNAQEVYAYVEKCDFKNVHLFRDLQGKERIVRAQKIKE